MTAKSWVREANLRWAKETPWINGDGQFALVARCGKPIVTLWPTRAAAERQKAAIDKDECTKGCVRNHVIVDLDLPLDNKPDKRPPVR